MKNSPDSFSICDLWPGVDCRESSFGGMTETWGVSWTPKSREVSEANNKLKCFGRLLKHRDFHKIRDRRAGVDEGESVAE